jgi:cytochrome c peroxidase
VQVAQAPAGSPDAALVAQGRALFNDPKLSGDGRWSCATCHPSNGHTDNKTYVGVEVVPDGDPKGRSTPTLWGAGTRQAYSWAGTAPSLEANIRGIIVNRMKAGALAGDAGGARRLREVARLSAERVSQPRWRADRRRARRG